MGAEGVRRFLPLNLSGKRTEKSTMLRLGFVVRFQSYRRR